MIHFFLQTQAIETEFNGLTGHSSHCCVSHSPFGRSRCQKSFEFGWIQFFKHIVFLLKEPWLFVENCTSRVNARDAAILRFYKNSHCHWSQVPLISQCGSSDLKIIFKKRDSCAECQTQLYEGPLIICSFILFPVISFGITNRVKNLKVTAYSLELHYCTSSRSHEHEFLHPWGVLAIVFSILFVG